MFCCRSAKHPSVAPPHHFGTAMRRQAAETALGYGLLLLGGALLLLDASGADTPVGHSAGRTPMEIVPRLLRGRVPGRAFLGAGALLLGWRWVRRLPLLLGTGRRCTGGISMDQLGAALLFHVAVGLIWSSGAALIGLYRPGGPIEAGLLQLVCRLMDWCLAVGTLSWNVAAWSDPGYVHPAAARKAAGICATLRDPEEGPLAVATTGKKDGDLPSGGGCGSDHGPGQGGTVLCERCGGVPKPARARHCKRSNMCVLRFDHYCHFIAGPVGKYNYRAFLLVEWSVHTPAEPNPPRVPPRCRWPCPPP